MGKKKAVAIDDSVKEDVKAEEKATVAEASSSSKKATKPSGRGKNYKAAKKKVDPGKLYPPDKAVELVKQMSYAKFDATVELHMVVKKQNLIINLELPNTTGKSKKIEIADENTIKKLEGGTVDFDILLATAEMMPKLVPFARILGPKGLMPNPKNGTLIKTPKEADKFGGNTVTVRTEKKQPVVHLVVGKVSQEDKKLLENVKAVIEAVGTKTIEKAHLTATMSPSVKLEIA